MEVSREAAIAACEQVRERNCHHYLNAARWQCWGCMRFGGEPEKRCMKSADGWDACPHVNRLLAKQS